MRAGSAKSVTRLRGHGDHVLHRVEDRAAPGFGVCPIAIHIGQRSVFLAANFEFPIITHLAHVADGAFDFASVVADANGEDEAPWSTRSNAPSSRLV